MSERKRVTKSTGSLRGKPSRHVCSQNDSSSLSPKRKLSGQHKQVKNQREKGNTAEPGDNVSKTFNNNRISRNLDNRMAESSTSSDHVTQNLTSEVEDSDNIQNANVEDTAVMPEEDTENTLEISDAGSNLLESELGAMGLDPRQRMLSDRDDDAMVSSIVCTDGSDVGVLTDEKLSENNSSDSIEVLDDDQPDGKETLYAEDCASPRKASSDAGSSWCSENFEKTFVDKLVVSDGNSDTATSPPMPVEAVVTIHHDEESECLLPTPSGDIGTATRMRLDRYAYAGSESSVPPSGAASGDDDEITPVSQGYDLMADLDNIESGGISRPDSLSLTHRLSRHRQLARSESESSSWSDICSHHSSTEALIEAATNTPLHAQGNVTREGDMIAFVAEDLTEKIRMSSPLARKEVEGRWLGNGTPSSRSVSSINSMSSSTSGWSTSSASGWSALSNASGMSRSPSVMTQSPEDIPPIDPRAIHDLEIYARRAADNLDHMLGNLKGTLHKMSALTVNCVDSYKDGIDSTCDSVDGAIKSMYALMAKCEELSKTMRPAYQLADQIKEIKRLLDLFEAQVSKEEKANALANAMGH